MVKIIFTLLITTLYSCSLLGYRSLNFNDYPTFRYQLQGLEKLNFQNSIVVIDYSKDGSANGKHANSYVTRLKDKNNLVLSYMSIGEAESYRFYFKKMSKSLLYKKNKRWEGNIVVRYWRKAWQKIIFGNDDSYLGQIINMGFDGTYLDIIDSFENLKTKKEKPGRWQNSLSNYQRGPKLKILILKLFLKMVLI